MSNLIKASFVELEEDTNHNMDENSQTENSQTEKEVPFQFRARKVTIKPLEEYERELEIANRMVVGNRSSTGNESDFEAGVPVKNFDQMFEEQLQKAEDAAHEIVEQAKQQAQEIVDEAYSQVETIKQAACEEGKQIGYAEGLDEANKQLEQKWIELEADYKEKVKAYEEKLQEMEPKFGDILCELIHKLTGVLMTDEKAVLVYLIHRTMMDIEPSRHYVVRVSTEDYYYVESHKQEIILQSGADITVEVQEDKGLQSGECILETDKQMLDCGFQTQLDNMLTAIRLLSR